MPEPELNPFQPPLAEARKASIRGIRITPWRLLLLACAGLVFSVFLAGKSSSELVGQLAFGLCAALAALGVLLGLVLLGKGLKKRELTWGAGVSLASASVLNLLMFFLGWLMALMSSSGFVRGRQIRQGTRLLLPDRHAGRWTRLLMKQETNPRPAPGVAERWIVNARTEHASVAAFARLTLDLMTLGAPPALLEGAQRDGADELRHTELCFALARALGSADAGPGAFVELGLTRPLPAWKPRAWAQLAVDSLVDGALHEGISARVVARLVRRTEVGIVRDILVEIARDEGRHAAHGWDVVLFCVEQGGEPVLHALEGALRALPATPGRSQWDDFGGEDGTWEAWGVPGRALEDQEYVRARRELTQRVEQLCRSQRFAQQAAVGRAAS